MMSLEVFIDTIHLAVLWAWGGLSLQHECVPGIFQEGKGGLLVTIVKNSGSLTLPETSGPVQICTEIVLPYVYF